MSLRQSDILVHNNPNLAVVDSDFIKGGFRTAVDDVSELYQLSGKTDEPSASGQVKEYSTFIYVRNEGKYYHLVDIDNIDNASGWDVFISGSDMFADNGLTMDNNTIKLGGELNENTLISGFSHNVSFNTNEINLQSVSGISINNISGGSINLSVTDGIEKTKIDINKTGITVTDNSDIKKGIEYADNYHSTYGLRSLPDVDYLTGITNNKLDKETFIEYTAATQPIIDNVFTGVTNLGSGTTIFNENNANINFKSISVGGDLTLTGDSDNIQIVGNYKYKVVDTLVERDNIPENERVGGMLVYVIEEGIEYRLENDLVSWSINEISYNKGECDWAANWYVEPLNGDDITGDGTESNPWKTLSKALESIPSNLIGGTGVKTIHIGEGTVYLDERTKLLLSKFNVNAGFIIRGKLDLVTNEYDTLDDVEDINNPFKRYLSSGQTFNNENEYYGYFARGIHSADYFMPIGKHGLNDLIATNFPEGYHLKDGIYESKTTLHFEDGRLPSNMFGTQSIFFERFNITIGNVNCNFISETLNINFRECVISLPVGRGMNLSGKISFIRCLMKFNLSGDAITISNTFNSSSYSCIIYNDSTINQGSLFRLFNAKILFQMLYINNFSIVYKEEGSVELLQKYGHYPLVYENIDTVFSLIGSGFDLNIGEWYGDSKIYLNNVNHLVALDGATNNINIDLRKVIQNDAVPNIDWITGNIPDKLVDPSKNLAIQYPNSDGLIIDFIELSGTPSTYEDGRWLKVSGNSLVYVDEPSGGDGKITNEDLGTQTGNFNIDLSTSRLIKVSVDTGSTMNITFTNLPSGETTVNTVVIDAINTVNPNWDSSINWQVGNDLDEIPSGYKYMMQVVAIGNNQSDIYIQYSRYLTAT